MFDMQSGRRPLTCDEGHDAGAGRCVILRHVRHAMTQAMTHP
ncbi:hypothetical protein ACIGZJ_09440 [Kitasatospora sp. NPDC052868]